jgi:uncharacterized protein (TIGR03083 family)
MNRAPEEPKNGSPLPDTSEWIVALRSSHDRFAALVSPLGDEAVAGPSYDDEWSIAQVASHLGSQAEIFGLMLDAGLSGGEAPGGDRFRAIWDRWDNLPAPSQAAESLEANERFVSRLEGLSEAERKSFALAAFGMDLDLSMLAAMRLGEHAVHTWDVAVALDPAAEVAPDAVELLLGSLPATAARTGKPAGEEGSVILETLAPRRVFLLTTGPEIALTPLPGGESAAEADASTPGAVIPAEALIRLVFGRLDPAHSPADLADSAVLAGLRPLFPGF